MSAQQMQTATRLMMAAMMATVLAAACDGVEYETPSSLAERTFLDDTAAAPGAEQAPTRSEPETPGTDEPASDDPDAPQLSPGGPTLETCTATQAWTAPNQSFFTHQGLLAFSPNGGLLARVGEHGERTAWRLSDGEPLFWIDRPLSATNVGAAWTRYAALEWDGEDHQAGVFALATGERLQALPQVSQDVRQLGLSPDGRFVVGFNCIGDRLQVMSWSVDQGALLVEATPDLTCRGWSWPFRMPLAFTPDSASIVVGGADGELTLIDLTTGAWRSTQAHAPAPEGEAAHFAPEAAVLSVALSPDGTLAASVGADSRLRVHRLDDLSLVSEATEPVLVAPINLDSYMPSVASPLAWSPDGALLAHQDENGSVTLRRATDLTRLRTFDALPRDVVARGEGWGPVPNPAVDIAFSPQGDALAISFETNLTLWRCDGAPLPAPPTGGLTVEIDIPSTVYVGQEFTFEVHSPDAAPLHGYSISLDGALIDSTSTVNNRRWSFDTPGPRTIEILVQDGARTGRATRTIEVLAQ